MRRSVAEILVVLGGAGIIAYLFIATDITQPLPALFLTIVVTIITAPLYVAIVEAVYNLNRLPFIFKTKLFYRNADVRLSIAYLFRIKSNGKYLLVRNRKVNYYQLVGGAYKAFPTATKIFNKYKVKTDNKFETSHGIAKNDLRLRVPGKNVSKMIGWFNSREDRETSQWREFCEELLTTNIIQDKHIFRYIDYRYIITIQTPIQRAKNLDCQEILIYEIFDLIPNTEQENILNQLFHQGDTDHVKWADEEIIQSLGFDKRTKETEYDIAPHTKWAVNEKYSKE